MESFTRSKPMMRVTDMLNAIKSHGIFQYFKRNKRREA